MAARSISGQLLRDECGTLERAVLAAGLATADVLKPWKPGGERNETKDATAWLRYLTRLHRFHARGETRTESSNGSRAFQDTEVLAALREDPIPVHLPSLPVTETIKVYPKSMDALLIIHGLDIQLTWMLAQRKALLDMETPDAVDALPRVADAISYTYQLLVWVVTHPGPEAPFAATDDAPQPPESIRRLEPWDYVVICDAHQKHMTRLQALSALLDDRQANEEGGSRPSWSVFYGTMSLDLGIPAMQLMKYRALVGLMASVRLSNYAKTPPEKDNPNAPA